MVADGYATDTYATHQRGFYLRREKKMCRALLQFQSGVNIDLDLNWAFKSRLPV